MIFEFVTSERELYYTDEERRLFRSMVNPLPPSFSAMWLGRLAQEADRELNFLTAGPAALSASGPLAGFGAGRLNRALARVLNRRR
jgi:hypothetical protein